LVIFSLGHEDSDVGLAVGRTGAAHLLDDTMYNTHIYLDSICASNNSITNRAAS
jgi:hypothetical protein